MASRTIRVPHLDYTVYPVYTNRTVSANFRGPEFPQGFFGIQSMMDDIAFKLGMDPVDFALKNMSRKSGDEIAYTNHTLEECIRRGAAAFDWKTRRRATPGLDTGSVKRGAGFAFLVFRSALGRSSAAIDVNAQGKYPCTWASPTSAAARKPPWA